MNPPPHFSFRPGTYDEHMFNEVNVANEYRLPDSFRPDDVIVDVGTHIGSFCHAALIRGSNRVHGFEADAANAECARRHLAPYGSRVTLHQQAAWRSDRPATTLRFFASRDGVNTGAGNVVWDEGEQVVKAIPFDDSIRAITRDGRDRVRLLKIDCEGAEFPILLTMRTLHLIDEIAGEYHEFHGDHDDYPIPEASRVPGVDRFTIAELTAVLQAAGFAVESNRIGDSNMGLFYARRPEQAAQSILRGSWSSRVRSALGLSR